MSYTIDDLDAAIEGEEDSWHDFFDTISWADRVVELPEIGSVRYVDNYGGEGQGDEYWFVFSVTDPGGEVRLFRRNGWYASFEGGYYEGPTEEVEPVETTIIVYRRVKK